MYFAILWKHPQISLAELQLLNPSRHPSSKKGIVLFDIEDESLLNWLAGIIKIGKVIQEKDLPELLKDCKIIGIQEETIGKHLKRTIGIRRFKTVKITHTDKEIREKWIELINLDKGNFWVVTYYQDIPLYEAIDFDKPGRSMQMGMMPAKLAHLLINIGLQGNKDKNKILIWDPFVGSGTTCFLANHMGIDTIGSDLDIQYAEINKEWRKQSRFTSHKNISLFTQDCTEKTSSDRWQWYDKVVIASEGRLGPIVTKQTPKHFVEDYTNKVTKVYNKFFQNILTSQIPNLSICITIPRYIGHHNTIEQNIQKTVEELWYKFTSIPEVYQREGQQVGRKICIITKG